MPHDSAHPDVSESIQIIRIITRLNIGGPSIQAVTLSTRLDAVGFRTLLVHGRLGQGEGDMSYLLRPVAPDVVYLPSLVRQVAPWRDLGALWHVYRLLRRVRPRIVHTHTAKAGTVGRLASLLYNLTRGRSARARLVHTYHGHVLEGYFSRRSAAIFEGVERFLARWTDALVAISPQIRLELLEEHRIGRPDQFHLVPLGFDLAPFATVDAQARQQARVALNLPAAATVVTSVGRLTSIKQPQLFLETARIVKDRYPDAVFLVAGDGELRPGLEALADKLGLTDSVRFLGWQRNLPIIYAATDVFLLTSRNEGTPVALIEAMAAGVPGVSTDVGGVRDVISGPELGVLVPSGGAAALAEAVCALLDRPELRRQMGERGRQSVLERYSLDRLADDIAALYRELLRDQE